MGKPKRIPNATIIWNTACIKCNRIQHEMVQIGGMVFCNDCYAEIFAPSFSPEEHLQHYYQWKVLYAKQLLREVKESEESEQEGENG